VGQAGSLERHAWLFMRVSGIVLLLMAVGHLLYMHVTVGVEYINYDWVLYRWQNPVWRLYDWVLLTLAVTHGANGVRVIVDDYVPPGMALLLAKWVLALVAAALVLMGSQIVAGAPLP
jgi:succinate dehydrogenase / fumarate reductase membrane anchor subunit